MRIRNTDFDRFLVVGLDTDGQFAMETVDVNPLVATGWLEYAKEVVRSQHLNDMEWMVRTEE